MVYDNKTVLVTGGTGSFGSSFVKFLLDKTSAKKIIIFSRDEYKQHIMAQQFARANGRLRFFLGDVRDAARLQRAFHGVDIVVHAAALKQVPALEYNPAEAVKTNILGTQNVVDAAVDQGVEKALLVSTDKAAHPVNLYGATKLTAEKLFVSGNAYGAQETRFSVVRYGNVIGSRGSIVEVLMNRIENEKLRITDTEMTRFWITLSEAHQLVTFALDNMEGGEVFIPKVKSMKLVDMFEVIAPGVEMETIGIRPGEKLHEVLLTEDEARNAHDFGDYFVVLPPYSFAEGIYQKYTDQTKIDDRFKLASHTNENWLKKEELEEILKDLKVKYSQRKI